MQPGGFIIQASFAVIFLNAVKAHNLVEEINVCIYT
jgi:hypothetical protein